MSRKRPAPAPSPFSAVEFVLRLPPPADYPPHLYAPRHVEIRLSEEQARAVRRLQRALEQQGLPCHSSAAAVQWLMERLTAAFSGNSEADNLDKELTPE